MSITTGVDEMPLLIGKG